MDTEKISRVVRIWAGTVLLLAVSVPVFMLWPSVPRVNKVTELLADCTWYDKINKKWRTNPGCLQTNILAFTGSVRAVEKEVVKAAPDVAVSIRKMATESAAASSKTKELATAGVSAVQNLDGAVSDLRACINDLHKSFGDLQEPVQTLLSSTDSTIRNAGESFQELTKMEATINRLIGVDNEKVLQIAQAMLDRIQDKNITAILENINRATNSGAEILHSIDTATRWMREKVATVKKLLLFLVDKLKVVFSPQL